MEKLIYEKEENNYINLYEEGIFMRSYEYSAMLVSKIMGYRPFPNIHKKTGFVYLEASFPKTYLHIVERKLNDYSIQLFFKYADFEKSLGTKSFLKDRNKLISEKKNLLSFEKV